MNTFAKQLIAIALSLAAPCATAEVVDRVLQLPFGKPLDRDLARCPSTNKRSTDYCGLGQAFRKGKQSRASSMLLMPPPSDSEFAVPAWVAMDIIHVDRTADGSIYRIHASTDGPSRQDEVIQSISSRFGKPTSIDLQRKQNAYGAQVEVKVAIWSTPAIWIYHNCSELKKCSVVFVEPTLDPAKTKKPAPSAP